MNYFLVYKTNDKNKYELNIQFRDAYYIQSLNKESLIKCLTICLQISNCFTVSFSDSETCNLYSNLPDFKQDVYLSNTTSIYVTNSSTLFSL